MHESVEERLRELAKRAGLGDVSPRLVVAAMVILVIAVAFGAWRWWPESIEPSAAQPVLASTPGTAAVPAPMAAAEASIAARIWVHIVGAVRHPGLYDLPAESRVDSAVQAAGGVLGNAAPEAVNLARVLADGEQIAIPTQDEAKRGGASAAGGAVASGPAGAGPGSPAGPVELNSATAAQLDTLPGVGPATAAKIVADREANGPFATLEDLGRVSGIGPKKLEELADLVSVR